jgi:glutamate dehydrogenase/leucine dehydrogenase
MLESIHGQVAGAARKLGLDKKKIDELLKINAEHIFNIELSDGQSFKAYRVQHNNRRGPYKGGIRFHKNVNLDEVRGLATLMTLKTAAIGLPLGGGKGGVEVDPKSLSREQLEELSRKYVQGLQPHIGPDKDVPAPDVNTNPMIIDWMVDEYQKLTGDTTRASFTGKSLGNGGSHGRDAATGRGGVIVVSELLKLMGAGSDELTYAVQGFGNVGSFFALTAQAEQPNWKLVATSDSSGVIYLEDGLDVKDLDKFKKAEGRFSDYKKGRPKLLGPEKFVGLDVDILVLAALEDAVDKANVKQVQAKFVVEMANGPISGTAYDYLTDKGITIVPDVVANAGGVIVSYLEWLQNRQDEQWPLQKVNAELEKYLVQATKQMYQTAKEEKVPLKEAALMAALKNLT